MNHLTRRRLFLSAVLLSLTAGLVSGADKPVKSLILPGESFLVDGRPAFILWPPEEKRQKPQPWIMYAPTLSGLPDRHEKWMHEQFLAAGVAVAGIDIGEAHGSPAGQKHFTALYRELTGKREFATKVCLLGRSRGGLWVSSWAIQNTDKVAGIAGIYPVFDLRSYPGLNRAASAYGLTPRELEAALDRHNPIARIDALAKAKVPVFIIHGDVDKVVPLKQNSAALLDRYRQAGAGDVVELVVAKGQGHNFWPGFFHCQELVDFAVVQAKSDRADETSYRIEHRLPWLQDPIVDTEPDDLNDGIGVSSLAKSGGDEAAIMKLITDISSGKYGNIDSLLIASKGQLVLESYYRRGRRNFPHYQMSITKSVTALALGRAIQLGYIKDLNTPVLDYLKDVELFHSLPGVSEVTIAECLNMRSGLRGLGDQSKLDPSRLGDLMKGQRQAQMILNSASRVKGEFKYQGTDPMLVMQVVEAVVPGTAEDFIEKEVLGRLGISNYAWQPDLSGLPKAAAGSSLRSRDMLKLGLLVADRGKWNGEQLWPEAFIDKAVSPIYANKAGHTYGYFWWGNELEIDGRKHRCISARGAGGQFIFILPTLDLIVVVTSHNKDKAMRYPFDFLKDDVLPAFTSN
jgi:CubicO group peptidase (beta-lactamase class C family)